MKELYDYLMEVISKCSKCKNCFFRHNSNYCYFAYECIRNDFSCYAKAKT